MIKDYLPEDERQMPDFARYEANKVIWMNANPDATPTEYEVAMRANAFECRI